MLKIVIKIILVIAGCLVVAGLTSSVFGILEMNDPSDSTSPVIVIVTPEPTAAPTPSPAPIPNPKPLAITKNENPPFDVLAPTTTMPFEELVGDNGVYVHDDDMPPLPPADTYKIVVDEYHQFATAFIKDENREYTVPVRYMITTTGAYSSPTVKGTFEMGTHYVRFGRFSCGVYGQYWRQITRAFYFHSLLYNYRNANSYTSSYKLLGKRGSHGCVRLMVPDARWIYYNCAPGTVVEIKRGDKNDEQAAAIKAQLVFAERPFKRPGLKPGEIPVTEAWPGWQGNAYDAYLTWLSATAEEPVENAMG